MRNVDGPDGWKKSDECVQLFLDSVYHPLPTISSSFPRTKSSLMGSVIVTFRSERTELSIDGNIDAHSNTPLNISSCRSYGLAYRYIKVDLVNFASCQLPPLVCWIVTRPLYSETTQPHSLSNALRLISCDPSYQETVSRRTQPGGSSGHSPSDRVAVTADPDKTFKVMSIRCETVVKIIRLESKRRRFHPFRGLRRMFRRKGRQSGSELAETPEKLSTEETVAALDSHRSRSTSELLAGDEPNRRRRAPLKSVADV
uniref:Uncharacterized protein n=1 Tax=Timema monikensis TaxID=170555 RepID=A0A7R9HPP4_9NEOP|nr:unnamed protein product [Timema monikensis]